MRTRPSESSLRAFAGTPSRLTQPPSTPANSAAVGVGADGGTRVPRRRHRARCVDPEGQHVGTDSRTRSAHIRAGAVPVRRAPVAVVWGVYSASSSIRASLFEPGQRSGLARFSGQAGTASGSRRLPVSRSSASSSCAYRRATSLRGSRSPDSHLHTALGVTPMAVATSARERPAARRIAAASPDCAAWRARAMRMRSRVSCMPITVQCFVRALARSCVRVSSEFGIDA